MAYIESIVTDMGNGGSYCGTCQHDLTTIIQEWTRESLAVINRRLTGEIAEVSEQHYKCPKCKESLSWGSAYVSRGGSDF